MEMTTFTSKLEGYTRMSHNSEQLTVLIWLSSQWAQRTLHQGTELDSNRDPATVNTGRLLNEITNFICIDV